MRTLFLLAVPAVVVGALTLSGSPASSQDKAPKPGEDLEGALKERQSQAEALRERLEAADTDDRRAALKRELGEVYEQLKHLQNEFAARKVRAAEAQVKSPEREQAFAAREKLERQRAELVDQLKAIEKHRLDLEDRDGEEAAVARKQLLAEQEKLRQAMRDFDVQFRLLKAAPEKVSGAEGGSKDKIPVEKELRHVKPPVPALKEKPTIKAQKELLRGYSLRSADRKVESDVAEAHRHLEHLSGAIEHLQAAGRKDLAENLRREAGEIKEKIHRIENERNAEREQRRDQPGPQFEELLKSVGGLREEVQALRREIRELREMLHQAHRERGDDKATP
jgi:tetratricopeptide (TPR) repeat protein